MTSVVLCMIVKDETHVIERCLRSVLPYIDSWVVVDTGSTDGTQQLVRELLAGVPGELVERPWKDFGHNRTEALEIARDRGDYSLMIDADEVFEAPDGFSWPVLGADSYALEHGHRSTSFWVPRMVANRLPWRYEGVLHEYLVAEGAGQTMRLPGPKIVGYFDGGRSVGLTNVQKYAKDAQTLLAALEEDPTNTRYQFYLARSFRDSEQWGKAMLAFRKRAAMGGGFEEEIYESLHAVAEMHELIGAPPEMIIFSYLAAHEYRPNRAESLCALARYCREQQKWPLARLFAAQAMTFSRPDDEMLFVDDSVYSWRSRDEFAVASFWTGHYEDAARVDQELLDGEDLPAEQRERVQANLAFALAKLEERVTEA